MKNVFLIWKNGFYYWKIVYLHDFLSEFTFSVVLGGRIYFFSGSWASEFTFQWFWVVGIYFFSGFQWFTGLRIYFFSGGLGGIYFFSGLFSLFCRFWPILGAIKSLILSQCQFLAPFLLRIWICLFLYFGCGMALTLSLALSFSFALPLLLFVLCFLWYCLCFWVFFLVVLNTLGFFEALFCDAFRIRFLLLCSLGGDEIRIFLWEPVRTRASIATHITNFAVSWAQPKR